MKIKKIGAISKITHSMVALLLLASLLVVMSGCKSSKPNVVAGKDILPLPTKPITEVPTNADNQIVIKGIFTYIDTTDKKMMFVDVNQYVEYEVSYHGGTDIKNSFDTVIMAERMKQGEIYDVVCNNKGVAISIYGAKDVWEKANVSGFDIDNVNKKIQYGSASITYGSNTIIMSDGEKIAHNEIVSQDKITIRGIGDKACSVVVEKGHGYLKLTGIDAFVGGYISIGNMQLLQITKNMVVTVQEGNHTIELNNGGVKAEKNVLITKGEESVLDFSEYVKPAVQHGVVKFVVAPENAILVLDGVEITNKEVHTLSYGRHTALFKASGYNNYSLTFKVDSAYETFIVDMVKKGDTSSSTSTAATKNNTSGYSVKVTAPTGASLYVDSVYVGTVPCEFEKKEGNKIVTLIKDGYETVSYTISITNTSGDVTYAFPNLNRKSE